MPPAGLGFDDIARSCRASAVSGSKPGASRTVSIPSPSWRYHVRATLAHSGSQASLWYQYQYQYRRVRRVVFVVGILLTNSVSWECV